MMPSDSSLNSEMQIDELIVLESIYDQCFTRDHDSYGGSVSIDVDLPSDFCLRISASARASVDIQRFRSMGKRENSDGSLSFLVEHLPPVQLVFRYNEMYPASLPPDVLARCTWLSQNQHECLLADLKQVWEQRTDCSVIIHAWVEFVRFSFLHRICPESCLDLDGTSVFMTPAVGSAASCVSLSALLRHLLLYNHEVSRQRFEATDHLCAICFTSRLGSSCRVVPCCRHVFCKQCLAMYLEERIRSGSVQCILCPNQPCNVELTGDFVQQCISKELFARYDTYMLNTVIEQLCEGVFCPRQNCRQPGVADRELNRAFCPYCDYTFCLRCGQCYHGVSYCLLAGDQRAVLEEYMSAETDGRKALEEKYGQNRLLKLTEEFLTDNFVRDHCKFCPKCQRPIEKNLGCNHMHCTACNTSFCWQCRAVLNSDVYGHFGTTCPLFPAVSESDD